MRRLILLSVLLLFGCHTVKPPANPNIVIFSQSLSSGAAAWYEEASTRFKDPVVVIGHGARVNGTWCIFPDDGDRLTMVPIPMEWVSARLRERYPYRPIVIISCNEEGAMLNQWMVYHSPKGLVWSWPMPSTLYTIGRIRDFVGKP